MASQIDSYRSIITLHSKIALSLIFSGRALILNTCCTRRLVKLIQMLPNLLFFVIN